MTQVKILFVQKEDSQEYGFISIFKMNIIIYATVLVEVN